MKVKSEKSKKIHNEIFLEYDKRIGFILSTIFSNLSISNELRVEQIRENVL
jgi:hypothetical protein